MKCLLNLGNLLTPPCLTKVIVLAYMSRDSQHARHHTKHVNFFTLLETVTIFIFAFVEEESEMWEFFLLFVCSVFLKSYMEKPSLEIIWLDYYSPHYSYLFTGKGCTGVE